MRRANEPREGTRAPVGSPRKSDVLWESWTGMTFGRSRDVWTMGVPLRGVNLPDDGVWVEREAGCG